MTPSRLSLAFNVFFFAMIYMDVGSCLYVNKRAHADIEDRAAFDSAEVGLCQESVICGWDVYSPFKREFQYFIQNTCECPPHTVCLKVREDVSIWAYVYKCQVPTGLHDGDSFQSAKDSFSGSIANLHS